eukprot:TRINITY_DN4422_c0_g1_i1.p1 TRINITY_DN4422_c0_g1~~TRINITY_DN4422_c0_g1_i1.p1  ORF type:complete len:1103 (-),score=283.32 TRINITY_DN4422_c0_g1_i1:29-3337(-)
MAGKRRIADPGEAEPAPARRKSDLPLTGVRPFRKGHVVRMRMKDFVTYEDVVLNAGAGLNLIVGPNGSGKSTVVCALCFALGGKPAVLGRADHVGDFVRHGCESATIELDLCAGDGKKSLFKIRRQINKDNSSRFWLDGSASTQTQIVNLAKELHINVDNFTTFLPQDKVSKFAEANSQQLLRAMEEILEHGNLLEKHDKLVTLGKSAMDSRQHAASIEHQAAEMERVNQQLEAQVTAFQRREELLREAANMKKKVPWLRYYAARDEAADAKTAAKQAKDALAAEQARLAPVEAQLRAAKASATSAAKAAEQAAIQRRKTKSAFDTAAGALDQGDDDVFRLEADIAGLKQQEQQAQQTKRRLERDIADLEHQRSTVRPEAVIKREYEDARATANALRQKQQDAAAQARAAAEKVTQLQRNVHNVENEHKRAMANLLQRLGRIDQNWAKAYQWVHERRGQFRGQVYGPLGLYITSKNPLAGQYIEAALSKQFLGMFVFTDREDRKLFQSYQDEIADMAKAKKQFVKVCGSIVSQGVVQRTRPVPKEQLAPYGVTHYLDELIEAPPLVLQTLCDLSFIHMHAVGTDKTFRVIDEFMHKFPAIRTVMCPTEAVRSVVSSYGNRLMSINYTVHRPVKLMTPDVPQARAAFENITVAEDRSAEIAEAQQAADRLAHEAQKANSLFGPANQLVTQLRSESQQGTRLDSQISVKRRELSEVQIPNIAAREAEIRAQIAKLYAQRTKKILAAAELIQAWVESEGKVVITELDKKQTAARSLRLDAQNRQLMQRVHELRREFDASEREHKEKAAQAKEFKELAEATADINDPAIKEMFATFPDTLAELQADITHCEERANAIHANPRAVAEYEERKRRIAELRLNHQQAVSALEAKSAEIDEIRQQWQPVLDRSIVHVNQAFGKFFRYFRCAGEVLLRKSAEEWKFDEYGLDLLVRFRDSEEMAVLSAQRNSGGERAVTTMLFMMALQGVLPCPFRVVDEINQGMDANNERRVFELLARDASDIEMPQYFIVTPKLLQRLEYPPGTTVHVVFNGPHMIKQDKWNVKDAVQAAIKRRPVNKRALTGGDERLSKRAEAAEASDAEEQEEDNSS